LFIHARDTLLQLLCEDLREALECFLLAVDDSIASLNELDEISGVDVRIATVIDIIDNFWCNWAVLNRIVRSPDRVCDPLQML